MDIGFVVEVWKPLMQLLGCVIATLTHTVARMPMLLSLPFISMLPQRLWQQLRARYCEMGRTAQRRGVYFFKDVCRKNRKGTRTHASTHTRFSFALLSDRDGLFPRFTSCSSCTTATRSRTNPYLRTTRGEATQTFAQPHSTAARKSQQYTDMMRAMGFCNGGNGVVVL